MKRIIKNIIFNKSYRKRKHFKVLFLVLILILIISITALIKFYLDVNDDTSNISFLENNIIENLDSQIDYKIFKNDEGMLGVKNSDDRNIIEPEWNKIYFLNSDRFAVQKKNGDKFVMGVIDIDENYITPFIFDKIISIGKNFLAGYLVNSNEKEFAILDTSGNIISDKIWTGFKYDDRTDVINLTSETGNYSYKYEGNMLICTEIIFSKYIDKYQINYSSNNQELIESISEKNIYNIYNTACIYLEFLLTGNINKILYITNDQLLNSFTENEFFENCDIKNVDHININLSDNDNKEESYILSAEISYNYKDDSKTIENLKSLITFSFVNSETHSVILKSINKEELQI